LTKIIFANILRIRKEISRYKISEKIIYTKTKKSRPEEKQGLEERK